MWNNFQFENGSNPYIAKTDAEFFRMIYKYYLVDVVGEHSFLLGGKAEFYTYTPGKKLSEYAKKKFTLQEFAHMLKEHIYNQRLTFSDFPEWRLFFAKYGKKYGCLNEFIDSNICGYGDLLKV